MVGEITYENTEVLIGMTIKNKNCRILGTVVSIETDVTYYDETVVAVTDTGMRIPVKFLDGKEFRGH